MTNEPRFRDDLYTGTVSLGVDNIDWLTEKAERLHLAEPFDLVTIGNAFHRLER